MNRIRFILSILILLFSIHLPTAFADEPSLEYKVKAAFLFRFLAFTDWPPQRASPEKSPILIGIVGSNPFGEYLGQSKTREINGRLIEIKYLGENPSDADLQACWLVFISTAKIPIQEKAFSQIDGKPILSVSDMLYPAGKNAIISFVYQNKKLGFEINKTQADKVGIRFRSKLLRLAANADQFNAAE